MELSVSSETIIAFLAYKAYPALLVLFFFGLTIFIHEFGHFLAARRQGMKVERFSIGFGPKIFGWEKDGVEYCLAWIPFGGYVALPQMSPMETIEGKNRTKADELPPARPLSKILVACAGPIMNVVLAMVLACLIWEIGLPMPVNPSYVGWIEPGSPEERLGIQVGDRIVKVNDRAVTTWMEISRAVAINREPTVNLVIQRGPDRRDYQVASAVNEVLGVKTINLYPQGRPYARSILNGSPAERAGVEPGDKFLSVEGVPVTSAQELKDLIGKQTGKATEVRVLRYGKVVVLSVVPGYNAKEKAGRMGVELDDEMDYQVVRPGPPPWQQFRDIFQVMADTANALWHSKQTGVGARSLSGPVGILGGWWHEIMRGGVRRGLWFAVLLNINLAIINLLPLPVLDGGHITFAIIESLRRKPLNARLVQGMSVAFMVLLIGFMLYVSYFDFLRLGLGRLRSSPARSGTNESGPAPAPAPAP